MFSPFSAIQTSGVPFNVTFTVRDGTDATLIAFYGRATLAVLRDGLRLPATPLVLSSFARGTVSRAVTVNGWGANLVLLVTATNSGLGCKATTRFTFSISCAPWNGFTM